MTYGLRLKNMKQEQKQQAQHLYFQTDLSQAEIAQFLGISRVTLNTWAREGDWARIRVSAQHMPCLITENLYMVMAKLTENILSELRIMRPITKAEAETLRSISLTIKNLNGRSSVNESLEMMSFFIEDVNSKDPEMAQKIKPFITEYIAARAAVQPGQFMHSKFNHMGHIPATGPDTSPSPSERAGERSEDQLDLADFMAQNDNPINPGHCDEGSNLTQPNTLGGETQNEGSIPPSPSERAGERSIDWNQYQEHVKQQAEAKAIRKQVIADAEETIKNMQQAKPAKNKHLNRAQRRELERQAKKQYPKAA